MAIKYCCIENCGSCSSCPEDFGVTYHKFPKDSTLRDAWIDVTQFTNTNVDLPVHVCSRHFRKSDFQTYKDSRYVLRSDAIPSIFPWTVNLDEEIDIKMEPLEETPSPVVIILDDDDDDTAEICLNDRKESEGENIEAIKKFIEEQEKEILELEAEVKPTFSKFSPEVKIKKEIIDTSFENDADKKNELFGDLTIKAEVVDECDDKKYDMKLKENPVEHDEETMSIASNVMNIILSESEAILAKKKTCLKANKQSMSPLDKGTSCSMALSVGSKVEAKDYAESWHSAHIVEVDYDEMEVLVHYDNVSKKHDEWINVGSPRLRPIGSPTKKTQPTLAEEASKSELVAVKEEVKEEKPKMEFKVGDRCLARWRDNRRFMATVFAESDNGQYEVVFDDGVHWICGVSRLSKMKDSSYGAKNSPLHVITPLLPSSPSTLSPLGSQVDPITTTPTTSVPPGLPFHTHLFDPTRDYLGSKSERRERKRKLNIKEIFNIGQKRKKEDMPQPVKKVEKKVEPKPKVVKKKPAAVPKATKAKPEPKTEIPDAVAAIIGTIKPEDYEEVKSEIVETEQKIENKTQDTKEFRVKVEVETEIISVSIPTDEQMAEEEMKLDGTDKEDKAIREEVINQIQESISKLEEDLIKASSPKPPIQQENESAVAPQIEKDKKKNLSKVKKARKLRLLQERKVKQEVEKVKKEMEAMKTQLEEMKKQVGLKTEELYKNPKKKQPEVQQSYLLPGEWACKWVNGQPVGAVSEIECDKVIDGKPGLPRRSVQVEDERLPPGWTKHMVRRSQGCSAGQWDVVMANPDNKRMHTRSDMRRYLEDVKDESLKPYEPALLDFGVHRKLSRRLGWDTRTEDGVAAEPSPLPHGLLCTTTSPIVKITKLSLNKEGRQRPKKKAKRKRAHGHGFGHVSTPVPKTPSNNLADPMGTPVPGEPTVAVEVPPLEDGYVYVGSLKVQIIDTLLRCPAEGCLKNFRNNTLLQMHIKHYHKELKKMMGATPKVSDLASSRAEIETEHVRLRTDTEPRIPKLKISKRRLEEQPKMDEPNLEIQVEPTTPIKSDPEKTPKALDSPKLRSALIAKQAKRPRVLLPVKQSEEGLEDDMLAESDDSNSELEPNVSIPVSDIVEQLDFESAISTHTVTKPLVPDKKVRGEKRKKTFATVSKFKPPSEDEEWGGANSDFETRLSFPRSGTPDSKIMDKSMDTPTQPVSSESTEDQKEPNVYGYTETGERVKIVHMKREEIINCHCGFREEDGLMIQCELCLCWQHALCHNIQKEAEVPEKYTCSICLNPRRGRRSQRFLHDQDRLYEGLLPGAKPCDTLKRSHELSGNLLRIDDALHALRVKYYVATKSKPDHPKLYLWAKDWEVPDSANVSHERLNNSYATLSAMIQELGKENLPESDRLSQSSQLGSQGLLSGLLSSPGGASLDLPISTSDIERLAKTVQEGHVSTNITAPEPEAAIENSVCRERLLRHIQRCQALIDARLDSIEAQVAELESCDPSFEDDETAEYFPRTKQTVQMLLRDLDTMEELGVIT